MNEAGLWSDLRLPLKKLDPIRVENAVEPGTPDVNLITGWMELKYLHEWPKRAGTWIQIDHFTPEQRAWLRRRALRKGKVWVFVRIANDWLLFEGKFAAENIGTMSRTMMMNTALQTWKRCPSEADLLDLLK